MSVKREISTSTVEIHDFKRLALSSLKSIEEAKVFQESAQLQKNSKNSTKVEMNPHAPIVSVLSNAAADFDTHYERGNEIGRGGFSTVYKCTNRVTGTVYAVKIIDLRPLRLREKFSPDRLRREVDIMRRLRHPNIIQFVEVYETADQLLVVMEYAPGKELFDVILAKKHMSEEDARPLFSQMVLALHYLHTLNIIHRDIKPENVLILNDVDAVTGLPIAKLLDFGLSKNADRSVAKTFVGTPCYLAPEVEFTSKGIGGHYGTPADCWSLGAVLYVMLVARFPEFSQDPVTNKPKLKMPPILWGRVSEEAKALILALMDPEPSTRMTTRAAMQHPWLGEFRHTPQDQELADQAERRSHSTRVADLSLMMEIEDFHQTGGEEDHRPPTTAVVEPRRLSKTTAARGGVTEGAVVLVNRAVLQQQQQQQQQQGANPLQFAPLLHLQRSVAACFEEAHSCFVEFPEVAAQVRRGAVLCREQLYDSIKMLRQVETTAASVANLLPDLEMALEEGEPQLAAMFFQNVYQWVSVLKQLVTDAQMTTRASMVEIQNVVEASAMNLSAHNRATAAIQLIDALDNGRELIQTLQSQTPGGHLTQGQLMELFLNLFGRHVGASAIEMGSDASASDLSGSPPRPTVVRLDSETSAERSAKLNSANTSASNSTKEVGERNDSMTSNLTAESESSNDRTSPPPPPPHAPLSALPRLLESDEASRHVTARTQAGAKLSEALVKLRQVDLILLQLRRFWSETADVLDMLTREGQVAEDFIKFVHTPRLMARFKERVAEYKLFWENVGAMCRNYLSGVREPSQPLYGFLDGELDMCMLPNLTP